MADGVRTAQTVYVAPNEQIICGPCNSGPALDLEGHCVLTHILGHMLHPDSITPYLHSHSHRLRRPPTVNI